MIRMATFVAASLAFSTALAGPAVYAWSEADCNEYALTGFPHMDGLIVDDTQIINVEQQCVLPHEVDGTEMIATCIEPSSTEPYEEAIHLAIDGDTLTINGELILQRCKSRGV